jgi:hypothetical protein
MTYYIIMRPTPITGVIPSGTIGSPYEVHLFDNEADWRAACRKLNATPRLPSPDNSLDFMEDI